MKDFFSNERTSLKICGVRTEEDAEELVRLGVGAAGFNFWPGSKRFLDPAEALWLDKFAGRILRVGVFVNEESDLALRLFEEGMIDVVQLHGTETPGRVREYARAGVPSIKALGVAGEEDLERAGAFEVEAILLDAPAPRDFGGTGECFDWSLAVKFRELYPEMPMLLAGGITRENAEAAVREVAPAALDVASGAERSPGVKDFGKVGGLLAACGGGSWK